RTGRRAENPGVLIDRQAHAVAAGNSAAEMAPALAAIAALARRLTGGAPLGPAEEDGYLPRGVRRPGVRPRPGAERAVAMLITRMRGGPFRTELPGEPDEAASPAPARPRLTRAT